MSSSSPPPAGAASAAISASEKVDGFTRKSVRKAQRQKRSQGSSQFRSQGSQPELHPLPQLKGNLRGRSPGRNVGARLRAARVISFCGVSSAQLGLGVCESRSPCFLGVLPPPLIQTGLLLRALLFSLLGSPQLFRSWRRSAPLPTCALFYLPLRLELSSCGPRGRVLHSSSPSLARPHLALTTCLTFRPSLSETCLLFSATLSQSFTFPIIKRLYALSP